MKKELADKVIKEVRIVPLFNRHIKVKYKGFADNSYIAPITIWSQSIEFRMNVGNASYFKRAIDRFLVSHKDLVESMYFIKEGNVLVVRPRFELCNN